MANPSFETDLAGWSLISDYASQPLSASRDTSWASDGAASLRLQAYAAGAGNTIDHAYIEPAAAEFGVYAFLVDLNAVALGSIPSSLELTWYGPTYGLELVHFGDVAPGVTSRLHVAQAPPGATRARFGVDVAVRGPDFADIAVDNARVVQLPNLVANPDFESGVDGWSGPAGTTLSQVVGTFGSCCSTSPWGSGGAAYLHVTAPGGAEVEVGTTVALPASGCGHYAAFATVEYSSGSSPFVRLTWLDAAGSPLGTDLAYGSGGNLALRDAVAPAGAVAVRVGVVEPYPSSGFYMDIDDVAFAGLP